MSRGIWLLIVSTPHFIALPIAHRHICTSTQFEQFKQTKADLILSHPLDRRALYRESLLKSNGNVPINIHKVSRRFTCYDKSYGSLISLLALLTKHQHLVGEAFHSSVFHSWESTIVNGNSTLLSLESNTRKLVYINYFKKSFQYLGNFLQSTSKFLAIAFECNFVAK